MGRNNINPDTNSESITLNVEESGEKEHLEERITKQIAKGGGISLFGRVIGKVIKFGFQVFLTRILGASIYGIYALGHNIFSISQTFSRLGLNNGVVRFGSIYEGDGDKSRLKGTIIGSLLITFLFSVLIAAILYSFKGFIAQNLFDKPSLIPVIGAFSLSLPFYAFMVVAAFSARIFRQMLYDVGLRLIIHPLTLMISAVVTFLLGFGLIGVVFGFFASSLLSALVGCYLLWRLFPELLSGLKPKFDIKKLLGYSVIVLLSGMSVILLSRADRVMLGAFTVASDVGVYNAAAIMAGQLVIFLESFNAIFSPMIANLYDKGKINTLNNSLKLTTKWIFTFTFPIFLTFLLFSKQIMGLYGDEFVVGWPVLVGLASAQLINASVGPVGFILTMTENEKLELANNLIMGGLNIILNFLLIPRFGILGAVVATGFSISLVNIVKLLEVYNIHNIHPYDWSFLKPATAGLLAMIIFFVIEKLIGLHRNFWFAGVMIFSCIYFGALFALKLEEEDRLILRAVLNKLVGWRG